MQGPLQWHKHICVFVSVRSVSDAALWNSQGDLKLVYSWHLSHITVLLKAQPSPLHGTDLVTPLAESHPDLKRLSNVLSEVRVHWAGKKGCVLALQRGLSSGFELYLQGLEWGEAEGKLKMGNRRNDLYLSSCSCWLLVWFKIKKELIYSFAYYYEFSHKFNMICIPAFIYTSVIWTQIWLVCPYCNYLISSHTDSESWYFLATVSS